MNNDKATPGTGDQDLTRLFDAQQEAVPEALDTLILTAAKDAVAEPAVTVQPRGGIPVRGWFAVAATLLLGFTLVPLLLQDPESSLDAPQSSGSTREALKESVSMKTEPAVRVMLDSESDTMDSAVWEETSLLVNSPVTPAIQTPGRRSVTNSGTRMQGKRIIDDEDYRRSPKNWLAQIRVLIEDQQPTRARTEYDLFRKAFPDYAPDFTLETAPDRH